MLKNEYRKTIDSIHAPKELLEVIKAESNENVFTFSPAPKSRKWIAALGYSGLAVAALALILLVVRPFRSNEKTVSTFTAANPTEAGSFPQAAGVYSVSGFDADEAAIEESYAIPGAEEAYPEERLDRTDGDEDEYYIVYNVEEPTYEAIFQMLLPSADPVDSIDAKYKPAETQDTGAGDMFRIQDNSLYASDRVFPIPEGRTFAAAFTDQNKFYIVTERDGNTFTTVYDENTLIGEARQSGSFQSYECKDTTIFDDDYSLSEHHVVLIETRFSPDLSTADPDDPATYCPSFTDASVDRTLTPDEITCLTEGSAFSVYGAIEVKDIVSVLYIFAELGE